MNTQKLEVDCAIAGGGPAGMMLGFLLARAGRRVLVLEKHADFLRDFRGDTIHPSTLDVIEELGLGPRFAKLPANRQYSFTFTSDLGRWTLADFSRLPDSHPYIAFVPQWDFLEMLAGAAGSYEGFTLKRNCEVVGLVRDNGRITGMRFRDRSDPDAAEQVVAAKVSVAADGRHSAVCKAAGLVPRDLGAPIDVLWFRLPRLESDPSGLQARLGRGAMCVLIDRGDYWQMAYIIQKGAFTSFDEQAFATLRENLRKLAPFLGDRIEALKSADALHLLSVQMHRLRQWYRPGLLCIGDAAHAMSPVGGIGINLAIQDAVAAANELAPRLAQNSVDDAALRAVERRRMLPTILTQLLQQGIHRLQLKPIFAGRAPRPRLPLRLLSATMPGRTLAAFLIGIGFRPEHVRTMRLEAEA